MLMDDQQNPYYNKSASSDWLYFVELKMTIPLIHEDKGTMEAWPRIVENCHFCKKRTRWWHENTNNPVCKDCSKTHKVAELPDHGKKIRARKRRERNKI
jgi:hypothetical protein